MLLNKNSWRDILNKFNNKIDIGLFFEKYKLSKLYSMLKDIIICMLFLIYIHYLKTHLNIFNIFNKD
jgi:hypothetical protein